MQELQGKTIEGVYACYAVKSESAKILGTLSAKIMEIINDIPESHKPVMKSPHYHLTLEYKGKVEDMDAYVREIGRKKRPGGTLNLVTMNARRSNVTGQSVPHLEIEKGVEIPFAMAKGKLPHVTLLEIENSRNAFRWFVICLDRIGMAWQETCRDIPEGTGIEIDASKVQVWGKVDGVKQLIVEV